MNNKSLKEKKIISEKLRIENKKMEVRLQQLKLTMNKEKEERLLNGNSSVWTTGAPGNILNYKPQLSAIDRTKKVKLKILKEEEEIVLHDVKGQLQRQNMNQIFINDSLSNRSYSGDDDNFVGKMKCGQCEECPAAVNCKECTEVYCAKCFAAFHLKGALRKHRSTPISNLSNRVSIPSPLFRAPDFNNSYRNGNPSKEANKSRKDKNDGVFYNCKEVSSSRKKAKENTSPVHDGLSLAVGDYDEELSTQYFQDALIAWRNNEDPPYKPSKAPPKIMLEHSTETLSTETRKKKLEECIHFTPSLSYAEQLLLRKHRTCQLAPVEMKFILNKLAKNNEEELLENQRLLQSNLELETAALKSVMDCGLVDHLPVNIGSLNSLWSEASLLGEREPFRDNEPFLYTQIEIQEVISSSDKCSNDLQELSPTKMKCIDQNLNKNNVNISENTMDKEENIEETEKNLRAENSTSEMLKLKLNSKRPHSAMNRNDFNDRPQSSRRMSARNLKGGLITSKPSVLLNMLATFNEYLPSQSKGSSSTASTTRSSSASINKSGSKVNYNFYKIAPQSWKPAHAWTDVEETSNLKETKALQNTVALQERQVTEYEDEIEKLNFFPNNSNNKKVFSQDSIGLPASNSSSDLSGDEDQPNVADGNCYDDDDEEKEALDQLQSFERELTLISRKEDLLSRNGDYDEILADSLDLQNLQDSLDLLDSDKFNLEDSLDFHQRSDHNSEMNGENCDDDIGECSSRFNDYDDVHNLC